MLTLYASSDKLLRAEKMTLCLAGDYCITIGEGRVYRLMNQMSLPRMSTAKVAKASPEETGDCHNLLAQQF